MSKNIRIFTLSIVAILITGASLLWFIISQDKTSNNLDDPLENSLIQEQDPTQEDPSEQNEIDDSEVDAQEPSSEVPVEEPVSTDKPSQPTVADAPEVYTAAGHVKSDPIPTGASTSTSCATEPNVECVVSFKSGATVIEFDAKTTDDSGAANWQWKAGEDIPSGKWLVVAKVGDKTSAREVIYVQ